MSSKKGKIKIPEINESDEEAQNFNEPLIEKSPNLLIEDQKHIKIKDKDERDDLKYFKVKEKEAEPEITRWELVKNNLKSGITVGLVNLSLSISLAVASGCTPGVGIVAGIYAGLISGLIGGSDYNIIGPTGALSSFVKKLILKYGESVLPLACMVVGCICFGTRILQMDKYIDLFPSPVTEGFTVGVALILFINQVSPALGMENYNPETSIHFGPESPHSNSLIDNLVLDFSNLQEVNYKALITFISFLTFLGLLSYKFPKFPSVIVTTILGITMGYLQSISAIPTNINTLESRYGELKLSLFTFPTDFSHLKDIRFYFDCLPISVIAILETLISAKIADKMTKTRFNKNQELVSLGTSNVLIGFVGGMPVTAALARTSLNVKTGATHRTSALINAIVVFLLSVFFFHYFKYLPICVIGSIVSVVAFKMVNFHEIIHYYQQDKSSFYLIMVGGAFSLLADPTIGLIVAMIVYFFMFTTPFLNPFYEIIHTKSKNKNGKYLLNNLDQHLQDIPVGVKSDKRNFIVYRFVGILNFMNIDYHEKKLIEIMKEEPDICIILSLRYIYKIDIDTLDSLKLLLENVKNYNPEFFETYRFILSGITKNQIKEVKDPDWFNQLVNDDRLVLSEEFDQETNKTEVFKTKDKRRAFSTLDSVVLKNKIYSKSQITQEELRIAHNEPKENHKKEHYHHENKNNVHNKNANPEENTNFKKVTQFVNYTSSEPTDLGK